MNNTMKQKCINFVGKNCCVYTREYGLESEIAYDENACLECEYNVGCIKCSYYEWCENRGKYE